MANMPQMLQCLSLSGPDAKRTKKTKKPQTQQQKTLKPRNALKGNFQM